MVYSKGCARGHSEDSSMTLNNNAEGSHMGVVHRGPLSTRGVSPKQTRVQPGEHTDQGVPQSTQSARRLHINRKSHAGIMPYPAASQLHRRDLENTHTPPHPRTTTMCQHTPDTHPSWRAQGPTNKPLMTPPQQLASKHRVSASLGPQHKPPGYKEAARLHSGVHSGVHS